ncbi:CRISPR-associated endoribonuclease Cas6 [Lyngbya aestuarii BL J]|uniref:CRISPR-associated endoribonuclease Cas6 n=1 Tax=Lyngbya aestuarii BL J TaxID=1348334 RepID=U7QLZ0_9CYAN|nr:CRISPR-associated endoribonuclease Cas6 [Lyngbya aestuarii]ERT08135.1 CRISPR-associated endoribonuclease Cas6 [Lyngbya aestuarii BL J]
MKRSFKKNTSLSWSADTELVGLVLALRPTGADLLYPQYTIGLHAWFLDQVRQTSPDLSAYLHDGESEKPFTISALEGALKMSGKHLQLQPEQTYFWSITALSQPVVQWLAEWVQCLPTQVELRNAPLTIQSCQIALAPTTYRQLLDAPIPKPAQVNLSFVSPTSFRRKGHHFPLPLPTNLFHSYLRRWNYFSNLPVEQESFLDWVDESVIIRRHQIASTKVAAGKRGMVTGFTGAIELGLSKKSSLASPQNQQLFYALGRFAPYCGTGHKTTFGLGQTRYQWQIEATEKISTHSQQLGERIAELAEQFTTQRKRTGGTRTQKIAETWATILARREDGESLQAIAVDLEMPYETVKTYAKLARRALRQPD